MEHKYLNQFQAHLRLLAINSSKHKNAGGKLGMQWSFFLSFVLIEAFAKMYIILILVPEAFIKLIALENWQGTFYSILNSSDYKLYINITTI